MIVAEETILEINDTLILDIDCATILIGDTFYEAKVLKCCATLVLAANNEVSPFATAGEAVSLTVSTDESDALPVA